MSDKQPVIGFIGLGYMGQGMAKNLVTKGYELEAMVKNSFAAMPWPM